MANATSVMLAGLGGAIVPIEAMPHWAETVAPVTPSYWAMEGFRRVILGQGAGVAPEPAASALLGFTLVLGACASWRFRVREK
ncbi:MAG: ABC transporter permease [Actinomycetota bacterium]